MKPTKEQFDEYLAIRKSGITNMCDIKKIIGMSVTGLTRDMCFYIMDNFSALLDEYGNAGL